MADNDGWIEWAGGECPIPDDAEHEVKFRDGGKARDHGAAMDWRWTHDGYPGDIIAYRIVTPDA